MTTPRRNRIDLHCHSSRSDGVLPPLELYEAMRQYGMELVALTDHDTLDGYRTIRAAGLGEAPSPRGPRVVPGIEINAVTKGTWAGLGRDGGELHILGYGMDPDDATLVAAMDRQRALRAERVERTVERLRALRMPVDEHLSATLAPDATAGRPHVARAMIRAGYVASVDEGFEQWLARGRPAYVPRDGLAPDEAIGAIRAAGGLAVLAHSPDAPAHGAEIERLQGAGLGGLEVYYARFDAPTVGALERFAEERGLVATGGSDYHGDTMSYADAQRTTHVPTRVGERLLAALAGTGAAAR